MSEADEIENALPWIDPSDTEQLDEDLEVQKSSSPEEAVSHAMDNFSPREANYSISHRLIPIMAFFEPWEKRLQKWVGIPQGMNRPLLPSNYFNFFTTFFDKSIKYSASRKGIGRQQIGNVLMAFYSGGAQNFMPDATEQKTERFHGVRQAFRKMRGQEQERNPMAPQQ
ncbi:MAG: hypothetical protein ACFFD2_26755 [Promethearchaeota archaeon]